MAQSKSTHDPDTLKHRLRSQLPTEWGVRVLSYPTDAGGDRLEVLFHHREKAHIAVRPAADADAGFKVSVRSPSLGRGNRRVLHPDDVGDDRSLDLARCLDRAVVKAYQYANTGQFFTSTDT